RPRQTEPTASRTFIRAARRAGRTAATSTATATTRPTIAKRATGTVTSTSISSKRTTAAAPARARPSAMPNRAPYTAMRSASPRTIRRSWRTRSDPSDPGAPTRLDPCRSSGTAEVSTPPPRAPDRPSTTMGPMPQTTRDTTNDLPTLPHPWRARVPDFKDIEALVALRRLDELQGTGEAHVDPAGIESEVAGQASWTRRQLVAVGEDDVPRAWITVHDRAAGRALVWGYFDREVPEIDEIAEAFYRW